MSLRHPRSQEVRRRAAALTESWEALKRAVAARGKLLEDNRDFLEFLAEGGAGGGVDKAEGDLVQFFLLFTEDALQSYKKAKKGKYQPRAPRYHKVKTNSAIG